MKKRIGNDIKLRWAVFNPDGTPVDFTGADVLVEIRQPYTSSRYPQDFEINGNFIDLQFTAKEQKLTGVYSLFLTYTKPDESTEGGVATFTVDNCGAFELVSKSCQTDLGSDPVYLEGFVSYGLTQKDKEDLARLMIEDPALNTIKGDPFVWEDFTPEQIEELQRPAIEAAERADEKIVEVEQVKQEAILATENANTVSNNWNKIW